MCRCAWQTSEWRLCACFSATQQKQIAVGRGRERRCSCSATSFFKEQQLPEDEYPSDQLFIEAGKQDLQAAVEHRGGPAAFQVTSQGTGSGAGTGKPLFSPLLSPTVLFILCPQKKTAQRHRQHASRQGFRASEVPAAFSTKMSHACQTE